jgi:hypothetical protein
MSYRTHTPTDASAMNLSYYCRGCKQKVRGIPLTEPQHKSSADDTHAWLICRCPTQYCELSFVLYDQLNSEVRRVFPLPSFEAGGFHQAIPLPIREDIAESRRCLHVQAYKAALAMSRRAVQNIVLDKIKEPSIAKKRLVDQIDELFKHGLITANLRDTAHEIRHFGNFGAHPSDDTLDKTTSEDAEIVDNLVADLVVTIYVTPWQTEQMKLKRNTSK